MNAALETQVDARNPWLGLASFTEETRAYFFGRDEEVAELSRRVQRKLLTVLFGQSGLGKTSILRAGLVPRLRSQGYCPVYVRIDYSAAAPEPAEQIKHAIAQGARGSGKWTQVGVAAAGESLWEFLHHRDDVLRDENGQTLMPLVIFDQFEEIFTLAQNDAAGRARAARFIRDLANLVENRPPREFEERLEKDESAAEQFDFARSDYRVLIALREDYLAPLESLKRDMPSISQNRLRLAPMTGQQALAAVLKPGKGLVNEEVASAIVRFVAGGAEVQNAEVEPALLSLVCRELNDARVSAGRSEISPDLLEGSQDTILSNFYERSLADQPGAVRRIVEDQLLTASGFRENIAEERLTAAFKAAGASPDALAVLVNRRLLRVEERLDLRRVELTHDVLCAVVKRSRDLRQEREAREASDRLLVEQREKEVSARRSLVRARQIAAVCMVLTLLAVGAAVVAVLSTQRAKRAEQATQQARSQAEALIGYLSADFSDELETYGQLSTTAEIARRQIEYFRGLPPSLKGIESIRNGALAMAAYARSKSQLGDQATAGKSVREAIGLLQQLRTGGDNSASTTIALARAYTVLSRVMSQNADAATLDTSKATTQLLEPLTSAPDAPRAARLAMVDALVQLGYEQSHYDKEFENGVRNLQRARDIAASLGARDGRDLKLATDYAEAGLWQAEILMTLGRNDQAKDIDIEAEQLAQKVLDQRPNYRKALHSAQIIELDLGTLAYSNLNPGEAIRFGTKALQLGFQQLRLDPGSKSVVNNTAVAATGLGDFSWNLGHVAESFDYYRQAWEISRGLADGVWFVLNSVQPHETDGQRLADAGATQQANQLLAGLQHEIAHLKQTESAGSRVPVFADCGERLTEAVIAWGSGDFTTSRDMSAAAREAVKDSEPNAEFEGFLKYNCSFNAPVYQAEAQFWLGEYAAAEQTLQEALTDRKNFPPGGLDEQRFLSWAKTLRALVVARQGRMTEAAAAIDPEVKYERDLAARNKGDVVQHIELARVLYVQSLTDQPRQGVLRHEALGLLDGLPEPMRKLRSTIRWRQLIQSARDAERPASK